MVIFNHQFIPAVCRMMSLLFSALAGKPKALTWDDAMIKAFQDTKKALARPAMHTHPRHNEVTARSQHANLTHSGYVCVHQKGGTALSTGSCRLSTLCYNTSDISWKVESLYRIYSPQASFSMAKISEQWSG